MKEPGGNERSWVVSRSSHPVAVDVMFRGTPILPPWIAPL